MILRPVPDTFDDSSAVEVMEVAERVSHEYLVEALRWAETNTDTNTNTITVTDVTYGYQDWFSYGRRRRRRERRRNLRATRTSSTTTSRDLQGKGNYVVIESTVPVGGTVTFASTTVNDVPTQYELYMLLANSLFPTNTENNDADDADGGAGAGLAQALSDRMGYSPALTGTFFAVDGPPGRDVSGLVAGGDGSTGSAAKDDDPAATSTGTSNTGTTEDGSVDDDEDDEGDGTSSGNDNGGDDDSSNSAAPQPLSPTAGGTSSDNIVRSPSDQSSSSSSSSSSSGNAGAVAGIVIASLAVLALGAFYVHRRRKFRKEYDTASYNTGDTSTGFIVNSNNNSNNINGDKTRELHDFDVLRLGDGDDLSPVVGPTSTPDNGRKKKKKNSNSSNNNNNNNNNTNSTSNGISIPSPPKDSILGSQERASIVRTFGTASTLV